MTRFDWKPIAKVDRAFVEPSPASPDFWRLETAAVYVNAWGQVLVFASPSELFGEDDERHNCDQMRCSSVAHVIARTEIP